MKFLFLSLIVVVGFCPQSDKQKIIRYNGSDVNTTYDVPQQFYGLYKGPKSGYLQLNSDGTGKYNYDVFGFAPAGCKKDVIEIEWGFLIDDQQKLVSFDREYGESFPILMKGISDTKFQGCRKEVLLDFIMVYKDGKIGVSSSDNWVKEN